MYTLGKQTTPVTFPHNAYLVKETGSDLLLLEETIFSQKKNCVASNATEEESDGSDVEDNVTSDEGFINGSKKSLPPQRIH